METPSVPEATIELLEMRGFYRNEPTAYATPFQKIIWKEDTFPIIIRAFNALIEEIDKGQPNKTTPYRNTVGEIDH